MSDVLHAGAIAVTDGWPPGDQEVERVLGTSIVLRAFRVLEERADLMPIPRVSRKSVRVEGEQGAKHGRNVETFDGIAFSSALLQAVRDAWPGVVWVVGSPYGLRDRKALYGFARGRRCVACIAQMIDTPVEEP